MEGGRGTAAPKVQATHQLLPLQPTLQQLSKLSPQPQHHQVHTPSDEQIPPPCELDLLPTRHPRYSLRPPKNTPTVMARPADPFQKVRIMMLDKDAQGDWIYQSRRPPNSTNTTVSTTATRQSPLRPADEAAGSYQHTPPHEPTCTLRSKYRGTPFRQRAARWKISSRGGGAH